MIFRSIEPNVNRWVGGSGDDLLSPCHGWVAYGGRVACFCLVILFLCAMFLALQKHANPHQPSAALKPPLRVGPLTLTIQLGSPAFGCDSRCGTAVSDAGSELDAQFQVRTAGTAVAHSSIVDLNCRTWRGGMAGCIPSLCHTSRFGDAYELARASVTRLPSKSRECMTMKCRIKDSQRKMRRCTIRLPRLSMNPPIST